MSYIDGFVIPVKESKLKDYAALSKKAAKVWKKYGALDYKECVGDDLDSPMGLPFPKMVKPKADEVIVFSFIVYKSKTHRNAVNKKVMSDPRIANMCDPKNTPFDVKRMCYGGFKTFVQG
jgi:uncharacterized protein YbaA (DUF1428 family)